MVGMILLGDVIIIVIIIVYIFYEKSKTPRYSFIEISVLTEKNYKNLIPGSCPAQKWL